MADCAPSGETLENCDIIKSTIELLPYAEYFESHLILLGTVLNVTTQATAIEAGPGDPTSKCLKILHHWLQVTPDPTWIEFCFALKSSEIFNCARGQIEKDHCKHRKVPTAADVRTKSDSAFSLKWMAIFLLIPVMVSCSSYYAYQHYRLREQSIQVTTVSPSPYAEDFDSPPPYQLTNDELNQLQRFKIKEEGHVWILLGVTGAGKSCLGNFIFGQDDLFPESEILARSETQNTSIDCTTFDGEQLCVIDTPALDHMLHLRRRKSRAVDIAEDASHLVTELTKMMLMTKQGINAFLIVVPLHHSDYANLQELLDFLDILGSYWDHSIVVFSHPKYYGSTEDAQYKAINSLFDDPKCPPILTDLMEKVNNRFVIAEAKEWRTDKAYRYRVVSKIRTFSDAIAKQHGHYQVNLQSIGNEALELAKLQLDHKFKDMESPEAKAAIFQSTFQHAREVVYKLVKIKLAGGGKWPRSKRRNSISDVHS